MKTLIIYDSFFGNTQKVAETLAESFECEVLLKNVLNVYPADVSSADCIFFGSPTRAFSASIEMKRFLKSLPRNELASKKIGLFDTRMDVSKVNVKILTLLVKIFGYAVDTMVKLVCSKGAIDIHTIFFYVTESEGPLEKGELESAKSWASGFEKTCTL